MEPVIPTTEERFEALLTYGRDVVLLTDPDGVITWVSPNIERTLGWQVDHFLGHRISALIHPDDLKLAREWRDRALGTPQGPQASGGTSHPLRIIRHRGTPLWCSVSLTRTADADRTASGVSALIHDIDDLVRQRAQISRGEALLEDVINAQVDPHLILRPVYGDSGDVVDFLLIHANQAAADFEGTSVDRMRDHLLSEAAGPEAREDIDDSRKVLETGEPIIYNAEPAPGYPDAQGRPTYLDIRISRVGENLVSYAFRDVSRRHNALQDLDYAHTLLRAVFDTMLEPHVVFRAIRDDDGQIVDFAFEDVNEAAAAFEGQTVESLRGSTIRGIYLDADEAAEDVADCLAVLTSREPLSLNEVPSNNYSDGAGRPVLTEIRISPVDSERVSYAWRDVSERGYARQLVEESERKFRLLAENMSDVVILINEGTIEWVSPSVTSVSGWLPQDLVGTAPHALVHPEDVDAVLESWSGVEGVLPRIRYRLRASDGSYHWVDAEGRSVTAEDGRRMSVLSTRIVDAEVSALEALEDIAKHDELTGLVNRHEVLRQVGRALTGPHRTGGRVALAFCDLDGFKDVNDAHGHSAGDALLRSIARRLERSVRSGDIVARLGGDELLVVLNGVHDLDDALRVAWKLRDQVCLPTPIPGGAVTVTASIGVALAEPGEGVDEIIARADAAMYEAKRSGKDRVLAIPVTTEE